MKPPLKLFVCEFITGGGFNHDVPSPSLLHEGQLMRDALLQDLSTLPYQLYTTVDSSLTPPEHCHEVITVSEQDDVWQVCEALIQRVDVVWLIAPESDGFLTRLTKVAEDAQKIVIGSDTATIKITSDKLLSYDALTQANITTIPTYHRDSWQAHGYQQWVAKPIDGAGCETTQYFDNDTALNAWLLQENRLETHIIQPFQDGIPASIACLMFDGQAKVLSCNKQQIDIQNNSFSFDGVLINGMQTFWLEFGKIANQIAETFNGLSGYVGIDVIVNTAAEPAQIYVVEINPRLTTSYVGLKQATGINVAELCMHIQLSEAFDWQSFQWPVLTQHTVDVDLKQSEANG